MKIARFIKETTFVVTRNDKTIIEMPTLMFALLMLFFWQALVPVLIIALFFDVGLRKPWLRRFGMNLPNDALT